MDMGLANASHANANTCLVVSFHWDSLCQTLDRWPDCINSGNVLTEAAVVFVSRVIVFYSSSLDS